VSPAIRWADLIGDEPADQLAALAIDMACSVAVRRNVNAHTARVPWRWIEDARAVLDEAGLDWQRIVSEREARQTEAARRYHGQD
jgi:hypothetical protein